MGGGGVESEFSDRFGYSLALAKPNNKHPQLNEEEIRITRPRLGMMQNF